MKRLIVWSLCILLISGIVSCAKPRNPEISKENSRVKVKNKANNKIKNSNSDTLINEWQTGKTVFINNEKYLFTGDKLKKGSVLRNIHMSEKARVKGTFVIVVKPNFTTNNYIEKKALIAKNTYRLFPKNTDDILLIYHCLLADVTIEEVELELIYGNIKNNKLEN